jgi:hypothetical protein
MKFSEKEIQMVKNSIELRQKINGIDPKHDKIFEVILTKLKYSGDLNTSEKALIRGCIKNSEIEPNEILNSHTELDLFLADENIKSKYLNFDLANGLLNKLKIKGDDVEHLFEPSFQKIDKIKKVKKIMFTILSTGKIYKLAFVTSKNNGYRLDIRDGKLNEFKITERTKDSYTNSGNASDLLTYLELYQMKNTETDNLEILKKIALKICNN